MSGRGAAELEFRAPGNAATGRGSEAVDDAGFVGVVGGHFDFDAVTDDEADEAFAHFAGDVGEDFVGVREFDPEHGACEDGGDGAFEFDGGFFVLRFFLIATNGVSAGEGTAVTGVTAGAALEAFFWRRHDLEGERWRHDARVLGGRAMCCQLGGLTRAILGLARSEGRCRDR